MEHPRRTVAAAAAAAATVAAASSVGSALFVPGVLGPLRDDALAPSSIQQQGVATEWAEVQTGAARSAALVPSAALLAVGAGIAVRRARAAAPAERPRAEVTACRAFENELGVQAPVGFFDPLGYAKDGDETKFKRRRASELKHGRISMLACMGYIAPEYWRLPGYLSPSEGLKFTDVPNGLAAMSKVPLAGGLQLFLWGGFIETFLFVQDKDRAPGDFANAGNLGIPFDIGVEDAEKRKRSLNSELANGRLAMVAILGMMFQNGFLGTTGPEMWMPASAFEGELGVQAPLGYFDPLGLSKDGDADTFYRRRCTEIKHGRVSMWAAMGYIAPEYFRWPGYLSPSAGIKFEDVPSGLGAFSKVPAAGWAQIFIFCGFMEVFNAKQDPSNPPGMLTGNDGPWGKGVEFGNLGIFRGDRISDPEKKKRGLNSELANGRLAMAAITGMLLQNGVTGTTGPEMWTPAAAFENELGVQAPVGFFDPLGYTKDGDEMKFKRRRASELKHGRISMFACMGYITPEYVRLPGLLSPSEGLKFTDMPNGLAAMSKMPTAGGLQMFLFAGFIETFLYVQDKDRAPGDFANAGNLGIPFDLGVDDAEKRKRSLNSELANGRLAMVAILGMMFQNGFLGTTGPEMWLPGAAFEGELGVQAPLGYFDPLGLSKDGDADTFYRRRCTEIKHGRVSMWAAMGYIAPEYFRWPGYLSPSEGIKFDDVPSGLQAFSKVPAAGWAQIFVFCGFMEVFNAKQDPSNPPGMLTGNDGPWGKGVEFGNLGIFRGDRISDPEKKKRGLNSELANGRLAMAAITGMMLQNGVTGTTGPEMWFGAGAFKEE